jgi:hypothetical protein
VEIEYSNSLDSKSDSIFRIRKEPLAKSHSGKHCQNKDERLNVARPKSNNSWARTKAGNTPASAKDQTAND